MPACQALQQRLDIKKHRVGSTRNLGGRDHIFANMQVLGAVLPPPFPSKQPARFYVGSLAVRPPWRRRGVGSAMLRAVETLGAGRHVNFLGPRKRSKF